MTRICPPGAPSTYERLRDILGEHFGRAPSEVSPTASLTGNLLLDRLDLLDLLSIVGAEFNIPLTFDDARPPQRVDDLVRQVDQLREIRASR